MHKRSKISLAMFCLAAVISIAGLAVLGANRSFSADTGSPCTGIIISNSTGGTGTGSMPIYGVTTFTVTTPTSILPNNVTISTVDSNNTKRVIGQAIPTAIANSWDFVWDTSLWPTTLSGSTNQFRIMAKVGYNGGTTPCEASSTAFYYIYSSPSMQSTLGLTATPTSYQDIAGSDSAKEFSVSAAISSTTGTQVTTKPNPNLYGYFEWSTSTNIGSISAKSSDFLSKTGVIYRPGSIAGTNKITATVHYGGAATSAYINVNVNPRPISTTTTSTDTNSTSTSTSTNNSTNTSTSTTGDTTKPKTTTNSTATPTTTSELASVDQITSSQIEISATSKSCIEKAITAARFKAIDNGSSRPTPDELAKITSCFAISNYILPSTFSPVDPAKIDSVVVDSASMVSKLENTTKTDSSGNQKQTLKFSGKAKPNSVIVLYIYSDPLVITTTTDSDGNWQYTLENPLQPGKHEVYTVVDKGDGTYKRSDPLSFLISTAAATDNNPKGLSLKLAAAPAATPSQTDSGLIIYIAGAAIVLVIALLALLLIIRAKNKHIKTLTAANTTEPIYTNTIDSAPNTASNPTNLNPPVDNIPTPNYTTEQYSQPEPETTGNQPVDLSPTGSNTDNTDAKREEWQ